MLFYSANAQSDLSDRLPLSDAIAYVSADEERKKAILAEYNTSLSQLKKNPFLKDIIPSTFQETDLKKDPDFITFNSESGPGSTLTDPSIVADALATFIATRFREELTISFLHSFREKLRVDSTLIYSFPNTRTFMLTGDPFNYKVFVASLRGALDEDIKEFSGNLPNLLKHIKPKLDLSQDEGNLYDLFINMYEPSVNFIKSPSHSYKNILTLISQLEQSKVIDQNIVNGLKIAKVLIKELGNRFYTDWEKSVAIAKLGNAKEARVFIGFVLEKHEESLDPDLKDILFQADNNKIAKTISYIQDIVAHSSSLFQEINTLKEKARSEKLSFADYEPLILSTLSVFKNILDDDLFYIIGKPEPASLDITLNRLETSVHFLIKLHADISERDYGKVVVNSLNFIKEFIPQEKLDKSTAIKEFVKYANFAINMAGAESAEAMVKALENAALPAQSWRLKRNSFWSVSINSYAGPFLAREHLFDNTTNRAWLTGFTAPIGVTFNWGLTKNKQGKFSSYPSKLIIYNDIAADTLLHYEKKRFFTGHTLSFHV
ncbi:MAG: hypothetical protein DWQ02_22020, partial [Bacteroidetes bacterium]